MKTHASNRFARAVVAAVGVVAFAAAANADIVSVSVGEAFPGSVLNNLQPRGGSWTGGQGTRAWAAVNRPDWDWGFAVQPNGDGNTWVDETWIGNGPVALLVNVETDGVDPTLNFSKNITNTTGFKWTAFQIDISVPVGVVNIVGTPSSPDFTSAIVSGSGTASLSIYYSGGSVVDPGSASFNFAFEVPDGPGPFTYTIVQTPIPAPGAFALLGVGGLFAARRRR